MSRIILTTTAFVLVAALAIEPSLAQVAQLPAIVPATGQPVVVHVPTSIDYGQAFGWLQPYVVSVAGSLLALIASWIMYQAQKWLGIKIDKDQADVYLRAATNQASALIAKGFVKIAENGRVEVNNTALAGAANELLRSVPDAAAHFSLENKPEVVAQKIVAMIPQVPAAAATVAPAIAAAATTSSR